MATVRICQKCGQPVSAFAPDGLCANCLLDSGLSSELEHTARGPASDPAGAEAPNAFLEKPGYRIGRYKLLQQIGEGGFGIVFMAEQTEPVQRRVALKVIKAGMDSREVIARFEAERQALALMDHPNIAQVLDGGATANGRPYFVMELVRGMPITEYCDQCNLSTRERLELFITVCRAVQHAHQKGVIHRDLKPSNVLVTLHDGEPVPKVIDFGIAKALGQKLTDKTLFTRFEQMIGTPAYMSPEQAALSGLDIDTRSDIYSLGVMLYELLTGVTPFDSEALRQAGLDEIRRLIQETDAPRPSTRLTDLVAADMRRLTTSATEKDRASLRRLLHQRKELINAVRGDLDWITMKALEKDRHRRYDTVNGLAADLERHLNHEPVLARPPSALYRFERAVRRHRAAFAAGAAVSIALVLGVVISTWQAVRATRAEREQNHLRRQAQDAHVREAAHRQRAESAVTRLEIERAENLFAADNSSRALAYLARLLRQQPTNRVVAERMISALSHRNFCLPTFLLRHEPRTAGAASTSTGETAAAGSSDEQLVVATGAEARGSRVNLHPSAGQVMAGEFSPDGQLVATASEDGTARIWDVSTGQLRCPPIEHEGVVAWVQFSPNSQRVVTASWDKTARVWDTRTGQPVTPPLRHDGPLDFASFSPDGNRVVTASTDNTVRLWDAASGQSIGQRISTRKPAFFAVFSADGKRLLIALVDYSARLFDVESGTLVAEFDHAYWDRTSSPFPQLNSKGDRIGVIGDHNDCVLWEVGPKPSRVARLRHSFNLNSVRFSPSGELVATASADATARIWDAQSGAAVTPFLKHEQGVMSVEFSPDGQQLATGSRDRTVRIWDARTGQPRSEPLRHDSSVRAVKFSPDGQRLLTISDGNTVRIWDLRMAQPLAVRYLHNTAHVKRGHFSPDGARVVTAAWDNTARVWDTHSGQQTALLKFSANSRQEEARFSPDGKLVVTTTQRGNPRIWDAATGKMIGAALDHSADEAHFSPDGQMVVTTFGSRRSRQARTDERAKVWDVHTGQLLQQFSHSNRVAYAEFSRDGRWIVTASHDKSARIWDVHTGQPVTPPLWHADKVVWAEFSPDSQRVVTASSDKTARVWNARTGQVLFKPLTHADVLQDQYSVQFSPDGQQIATAAGNVAQIWEASSGHPITAPLRHGNTVNSARFSPDGSKLVTACQDGAVRVWDTATGHLVQEPFRHDSDSSVFYAEFSPDGRYVISASSDKTARVWHIAAAPLPIPNWLADLAEAVAGEKIDADDSSSAVPVELFFKLKEGLAGIGNLFPPSPQRLDGPGALATSAAGVDALAENAGVPSYYRTWVQWFFAQSATRTLSPSSPIRMPEYVQRRIEENTIASLEEALQLSPTNALAFASLAWQILAAKPAASPRQTAEADWYSRHAVELAPDQTEIWWRRAETLVAMGRPGEGLDSFVSASERSPTNPEFWKAMGATLAPGNRTNEALQAFGKAIDLARQTTNGSLDTLNAALLLRSKLLKEMGRHAEARADFPRASNIPERDPTALPSLIDLSDYYNVPLDRKWHDEKSDTVFSLSRLPRGVQTLDGVEFDIRGVVLLLSSQLSASKMDYPRRFDRIQVGRKCHRVHFLHAATWTETPGTEIGGYTLHFVDGELLRMPLVYGEDVKNTVVSTNSTLPSKATVAWTGTNSAGSGLRLFHSAWKNPRPEVEVLSIDFVSEVKRAAPFLIAITVE